MKNNQSHPVLPQGSIPAASGAAILGLLYFGPRQPDPRNFFLYVFTAIGVFLLIVGLAAMFRTKRISDPPSESPERPSHLLQNDPQSDGLTANKVSKRSRSVYYKFAMAIGFSPAIPLVMGLLKNGLGGESEDLIYIGGLGWVLSLPAWALLVFAGKLLKIR